jgi:NTE family protein
MRRKEDDLRLLGGVEVGLSNGKIAFPQGLIQGQKLEMLLRRLLLPTWQVNDFDHLPIPFRAIATDIVSGEKVVFGQGDLALAIRASMSVPGVFAPVRYEGHLLVDGGVVDNVPIDEARRLGAQRLIVSRVGLAADDRGAAGFAAGDQPPDGQRADAARSAGAAGHARPTGSADHTAAG